jgi:hypothetical protein
VKAVKPTEQERERFIDKYAGLLHLSPEDQGFEAAMRAYHRAVSISPRIERITTALDLYRAALESENVRAHFILLMLVVDRLFSPGLRSKVLVRGLRDKISSILGEQVPAWVTTDYRSRNRMLYGTARSETQDDQTLRDVVCLRWRNLLRRLLREILVRDKVRLFASTRSLKNI